jgi:glycosyltransferase involved in cell wall biosynthesis
VATKEMNTQRRRILFLAAWYPSEDNPVAGIFVREHARAAHLYNDVVVLYVYLDPSHNIWRLYRATEDIEDGIRTIRVKYGGALLYIWLKLTDRKRNPESLANFELKSSSIWSQLSAIPVAIVNDLLYCWSVVASFRDLVNRGWKPDIIHAHVFTAGTPGVILGKLCRIPVVITEHWDVFLDRKLTFFDRLKARFSMNRAKIILPVSNALKMAIEAYGIKNAFRVIPNAVNTEVFYLMLSDGERVRSKKRVLFVGILTPVKGVPFLLQAVSYLKGQRQDFTLDIVGNGTNRLEHEELARTLRVLDIVKFHGLIPKVKVAEFMRACEFLVAPSLHETFGVALIEAMACGKPVIATQGGGSREIVDDRVGILVPPQDFKALAKAINYMLDNYKSYSPEGIAQYAKEHFGYEAIGHKLDRIYGELILGESGDSNTYEQKGKNH